SFKQCVNVESCEVPPTICGSTQTYTCLYERIGSQPTNHWQDLTRQDIRASSKQVSAKRETVDDRRSCHNQRACVSGGVFPDYAAVHLQLAPVYPGLASRYGDAVHCHCGSSSSLCGCVTLCR